MAPRRIVFGLLCAFLLAGCSSGRGQGAPAASAGANDPPPTVALVSEDTGGIEGLVTDDSWVPLDQAHVSLLEIPEHGTVTSAEGQFALSNVPPGTWTLGVGRLGYESVSRRVNVYAGEVTKENLVLLNVPTDDDIHLTSQRDGRIGCGFSARPLPAVEACAFTYGTAASSVDEFRVDFTLRGRNTSTIQTLVLETKWQSNQALSSGLDISWETYQEWGAGTTYTEGPPRYYARVIGNSPLRVTADYYQILAAAKREPAWKHCDWYGECKITALAFPYASTIGAGGPVDVAVYIDQRFTHYVSEFYGAPASRLYSALADK